MLKNLPF